MASVGYARVSTTDQNVQDQVTRLTAAGCEKVFTDIGVSGKYASRPQWDACLAYLRPGDTLVITKLDRAGRSLQHLVELATELRDGEIKFKTLDQAIDTTTSSGRLQYNILAAVAEFERELISERTHEGLRTARANGKFGGRKPRLNPKQQTAVVQMRDAGNNISDIAAMFDVSRTVIYRVLEAKDNKS